ncbi:hypothetical protein [Mycolicibacterium baixiangningiae]|uniref:hypothetical protein n=1 Tax=Mycolicibacterium baixiangningiae TaxID=2761578 RepID=UPI001866B190|nr:hypothetical protein [Mycolicibacterium baixiangningiae]
MDMEWELCSRRSSGDRDWTWNLKSHNKCRFSNLTSSQVACPLDVQLDMKLRFPAEARGSRISAVLLGESLRPWDPLSTMSRLSINPCATAPLGELAPFASLIVDGQDHISADASMTGQDIFGTTETATDLF